MRQVIQGDVIAVDKALAEDVPHKVKGEAKQGEGESVGLDDADDDAADTQSHHSPEVAEPGNAQQIHGDAGSLAHGAHHHTDDNAERLLALFDDGQQRLRAGHARRPRALGGEHGRIKATVKDGCINDRSQGASDQHGNHQLRIAHDHGDTDGQQHAVGHGECGTGDRGLDQVLAVDIAEFLTHTQRDPGKHDGKQCAYQRRVGGGSGGHDQFHADDGAQNTHDGGKNQRSRLIPPGVLFGSDAKAGKVFIFHFSSSLGRDFLSATRQRK